MSKEYAIDIINEDIKEFMHSKGITKSEVTIR